MVRTTMGLVFETKIKNRIRSHSGVLYALYWLCLASTILSTRTSPVEKAWTLTTILIGILFAVVLLLHITAPNVIVGPILGRLHEPVQLGKENSASLMSRWTFLG